jgi:hypothetical protein
MWIPLSTLGIKIHESPSSTARQQTREEEDLLGERAWRRAMLA